MTRAVSRVETLLAWRVLHPFDEPNRRGWVPF
jgi:hypothetical protein